MLATLPGTVVLYYGDEIGMTDLDVPPEFQRDSMTIGAANPRGNRDRARTPLRWDDSPDGGFTTGSARPWLPLPPASAPNVAGQRADRGSILWLCRELIALRHADAGFALSSPDFLPAPDGLLAYRAGDLLVAANLTAGPIEPPPGAGEVLLSTSGRAVRPEVLPPWQGIIARWRPETL